MKHCVIIPARFRSTRFPAKPLAPLLGKPMILWVAEPPARAVGESQVKIAIEDEMITELVGKHGLSP